MRFAIRSLTLLFLSVVGLNAYGQLNEQHKTWRFDVYLDDKPIGYHQFVFSQIDNESHMKITAEFDVRFLFFSVYTYAHDNTEVWQGNCLASLRSNTLDNGEKVFVELTRENDSTLIKSSKGVSQISQCIRSFAYWNPEILDTSQLLNAQTGELIDIEFSYIGNETIRLNDQQLNSKRYRILGENLSIDLWYSSNNHWLALQSTTEDGYQLRYQLQTGSLP